MRNSKPKYHKAMKGSFSSCKEWLLTSPRTVNHLFMAENLAAKHEKYIVASQYGSYNHVPGAW